MRELVKFFNGLKFFIFTSFLDWNSASVIECSGNSAAIKIKLMVDKLRELWERRVIISVSLDQTPSKVRRDFPVNNPPEELELEMLEVCLLENYNNLFFFFDLQVPSCAHWKLSLRRASFNDLHFVLGLGQEFPIISLHGAQASLGSFPMTKTRAIFTRQGSVLILLGRWAVASCDVYVGISSALLWRCFTSEFVPGI